LTRGKGTIVIDPDRAHLIKKLFEMYASGHHSVAVLLAETKEWGLTNSRGNQGTLGLSHLHKILQNPFYYGVMKMQKTGKTYPHMYPPIITKELFNACIAVRSGRHRKQPKWKSKEFIFRDVIECAVTGKTVTPDIKIKTYKNGQTASWNYLITYDPENINKKIYVKEKPVLQEIEAIFKSMQLEPEMLKEVTGYIKNTAVNEKEIYQKHIRELKCEYTKTLTKLNNLNDLFLEGLFDKDTFQTKRQELTEQRDKTLDKIELHNKADDNFQETMIRLIELASGAYEAFKGSKASYKNKLIKLVFSNLKLNGWKLEYSLRPPFNGFVNLGKNSEWCGWRDLNPHAFQR
jgi:site-specific DNA recombinase